MSDVLITENQEDVFINQKLDLTLRFGVSIVGATMLLLIKDPDDVESQETEAGIVSVTDAALGYVLCAFPKNQLNKAGRWELKLKDDVTGITGKTFTLYVNDTWQR